MCESKISGGATEKLLYSEELGDTFLHGLMLWKVMQRSAWNDIANWRTEQLNNYYLSQLHACLDDDLFKEEEMGSVGELSRVCSQIL